jgi:hypothetical protein
LADKMGHSVNEASLVYAKDLSDLKKWNHILPTSRESIGALAPTEETADLNCPTTSFSSLGFLMTDGRGIGFLNIVRELYNTYI